MQRPRDALTERMQHRVESEMAESDAALFVINAEEGVGPGERFIAGALRGAGVPVVIAVNKVDRLDRAHTLQALTDAAALDIADEIFPVSARTGRGVAALRGHLAALMPESPFLFPAQESSDQPRDVLMAELVREQVLRRTFQEVPHAVEVVIDDVEEREDGLTLVRALVWVEAESQKGILIGAGGRMIKAVGTAARRELERELGTRVHLDLSVRVRRGWRGRRGAAGPAGHRMSGAIVAMGGGGFSEEPDNPLLDGFVLGLARRERPRVCFLGTASGDAEQLRHALLPRLRRRTTAALGPRRSSTARWPTCAATSSSRTSIYVGGGNTASLLAVWRAHGLDTILQDALAGGAVLCGVSAGMNCWFEASVTDSFGPALAPLDDGLGFMVGSACPHYDAESTAARSTTAWSPRASPPGSRPTTASRCTSPPRRSSSRWWRRARAPAATASSGAPTAPPSRARCPRAISEERRLMTS